MYQNIKWHNTKQHSTADICKISIGRINEAEFIQKVSEHVLKFHHYTAEFDSGFHI